MIELNPFKRNELVTNCDRFENMKHPSVNPIVYTEQGVAMLPNILRSEKAIQINIEIMRSFARYRAIIRESEDLRNEINRLDNKLNKANQFLMDRIDELHQKKSNLKRQLATNTAINQNKAKYQLLSFTSCHLALRAVIFCHLRGARHLELSAVIFCHLRCTHH